MIKITKFYLTVLICFVANVGFSQNSITNIKGRNTTSLNGKWEMIIDWYNKGQSLKIQENKEATNKDEFIEYAFDSALTLNVPGDWNSQRPELKYFEGSVWYKREFNYKKRKNKKTFVYFGAVNYETDVYLNGKKLGSHEGGFSPFQFEITDDLREGNNKLILRVNNERHVDGIPAKSFDWWNYGGITRDVDLVETEDVFVADYFLQLEKNSRKLIKGWVKLNQEIAGKAVTISIPEAKIKRTVTTDRNGYAPIEIEVKLSLWSPEEPKLYSLAVITDRDTINEEIGFRNIEVKGTDILLNGKSVFLKGINFHEEIPQRMARATSESDAAILLNWAKDLGCNFVRLSHYPQNEYIVKLAEKMGIMLWEEIPVWQGIEFTNPMIMDKAHKMLKEMVSRDKNRCAIIIWSLSNETNPSKSRDAVISKMAKQCREMDSTRLISSALHNNRTVGNKIYIEEDIINSLDIIAINRYLGWYAKWPANPEDVEWISTFNKPMIMTEFGAEALYGTHGPNDVAGIWSEDYQAQLYRDNIKMFKNIPFLRGTTPWILADFRTPFRMQPSFQDGWNRKGLLSDKGEKKEAWYVMKDYYDSIGTK